MEKEIDAFPEESYERNCALLLLYLKNDTVYFLLL